MGLACCSAARLQEGRKPLLKPAVGNVPGPPISDEALDGPCRCAPCSARNQKLLPRCPLKLAKVATVDCKATLMSQRLHHAKSLLKPKRSQRSIVATFAALGDTESSSDQKTATIERATSWPAIRNCNLRRAARRVAGLAGPVAGPDRCRLRALALHGPVELLGRGPLTSAICRCGSPAENHFLQP